MSILTRIISASNTTFSSPLRTHSNTIAGGYACCVIIRSLSSSLSFSKEDVERANNNNTTGQDSSLVEIRQTADGRGWGLFARHDIPKGAQVFRGKALDTSRHRCAHSVQTNWNRHVIMDLPAILVNHSCEANVGIRGAGPNELGAYDFDALQDVESGREVLWDYETAESEIEGFLCSCGASDCRGQLKGYSSEHGALVLKAYGKEHIASYLLREEEEGTDVEKK
jgi:hypothetical protein